MEAPPVVRSGCRLLLPVAIVGGLEKNCNFVPHTEYYMKNCCNTLVCNNILKL